jgi:SnoaL-like domain
MDAAAELREIESIKQLKARYCRYLDTKDWSAWRAIFTDDFVSDTAEAGGRLIVGADEFVAYIRKTLGKPSQPTVHQVHAPEIELLSETTARGVWALEDVVRLAPGVNLNGYGHYHETYEKTAGQWRIKTSKLTRLREDIFNPIFSVRVSGRLRDAGAKVARRYSRK